MVDFEIHTFGLMNRWFLFICGAFCFFYRLLICTASDKFSSRSSANRGRRWLFQVTEETVISVENEAQEGIASDFADLFTVPAGFTPMVEIGGQNAAISLVTDKALKRKLIG